MPRLGQLKKGGKTAQLLAFLKASATPESPLSSNDIAEQTGQVLRAVRSRLFELIETGHVVRVAGSPLRFHAGEAAEPPGPAVAIPLPCVRAAMPMDRSLRPQVGVVMLLDQQRRAA